MSKYVDETISIRTKAHYIFTTRAYLLSLRSRNAASWP
jgi:hypothetical protein